MGILTNGSQDLVYCFLFSHSLKGMNPCILLFECPTRHSRFNNKNLCKTLTLPCVSLRILLTLQIEESWNGQNTDLCTAVDQSKHVDTSCMGTYIAPKLTTQFDLFWRSLIESGLQKSSQEFILLTIRMASASDPKRSLKIKTGVVKRQGHVFKLFCVSFLH